MSAKNEPNKPDDSTANKVDVPRLVRLDFPEEYNGGRIYCDGESCTIANDTGWIPGVYDSMETARAAVDIASVHPEWIERLWEGLKKPAVIELWMLRHASRIELNL